MMAFKVGDRVRCVQPYFSFALGGEYTITAIQEYLGQIYIGFVGDQHARHNAKRFELVTAVATQWGAEIEVNGKQPEWLRATDLCDVKTSAGWVCSSETEPSGSNPETWAWTHSFDGSVNIHSIRLPENHPYYLATSNGFTYWPGGDGAPADWDGGDVLRRSSSPYCDDNKGRVGPYSQNERWTWLEDSFAKNDIIGYRKRAGVQNPTVDWTKPIEAVRKSDGAVFPLTLMHSKPDDLGHYITNEVPEPDETNRSWKVDGSDCCAHNKWFVRNRAEAEKSDTVTVKRMTEAEVSEMFESVEDSCNYATSTEDCVAVFRSLGLIRDETRAEKFARETGHEVTPAVEAALGWERGAA